MTREKEYGKKNRKEKEKLMQKKIMIRLSLKRKLFLMPSLHSLLVFHFCHPKTLLANRIDGWHRSLRPATVGKTKPEPVGREY